MTIQRQVQVWLGALAVFVLSLWYLQDILLPFVAGFVLAYFLDPVADWLERLGFPRVAASLLILLVAVMTLVFIALLVVPVLSDQLLKLAADLPELLKSLIARFDEIAPKWIKDLLQRSGASSSGSLADLASGITGWLATIVASVWSGGMAFVNLLSLLVVTPIVAFYLLADWDNIVAKVDSLLPRDHTEDVRAIARDIDTAMAGFIRGQGTVCLLLGIFYAIALSIAGLRFGLAIGFGAGLLSFIPYVGAIIGGVLAIGVALVQFWPDYTSIIIVAAIFAAGQFIEGNFLSPKLVGSSIGLHPVWLMFALFAFGYTFGFAGLLLAVPLAAAAGVLVRHMLARYQRSKLFTGVRTPANIEPVPEAPPKRRKTSA
jgi:predicted PurR-regulated permease PerM